MAQFRNISGESLFVATDRGLVECENDSILDVSDEFAAQFYFQTGDTGETPLFEAVIAQSARTSKASTPTPVADTTPAE
jgi:hypothetical protein